MLFLETSDGKSSPEDFRKMLQTLKAKNVFKNANGVLFGKPQDEAFMNEYIQIIKEELADKKVLFNLNFGHAYPRCIVPYGIKATVDFNNCTVEYSEEMFEKESRD